MSEDFPLKANPEVEVSVGWNSPLPKIFPESADSADVSLNIPSNSGDGETPKPKEKYMINHPNTEMLGAYSSFLPGSSPPRPRHRVRKRKPESPLRYNSRLEPEPILATSVKSLLANPPNLAKRLTHLPSDDSDSEEDIFISAQRSAGSTSEQHSKESLSRRAIEPTKLENANVQHNFSEDTDDTDSDLEDIMQAAAPVKYPTSFFENRRAQRFVVQRVSTTSTGSILFCSGCSNRQRQVKLEDSWADTIVKRGDTIHIVYIPATSEHQNSHQNTQECMGDTITINDNCLSYAIVNPDILVPCTSVAEALSCERQVVLRSQVRVPSDLNESLVLGSIKHEFIQSCFTNDIFGSADKMIAALNSAIEESALELLLVNSDVPSALNNLLPIVPEIQAWAATLWGPKAAGRHVDVHGSRDALRVRLNRAAYIEEEIRSTSLGLVGKIDITCEATDIENKLGGGHGSRLIGLEIKTGKSTQSISHRAQTSLYTLLLAERHPNNTHPWSLLYYSESSTTICVRSYPLQTRALLQKRNAIAHGMWHLPPGILPLPTASADFTCHWCSRSNSCILYTATTDNGNVWENSALLKIYNNAQEAGILDPQFLEFLKHWHNLLELEYETSERLQQLRNRQWWLKLPKPMMWRVAEQDAMERSSGFSYRLVPQDLALLDDKLKPGDNIIVSTKQHMGVTFGIVIATSPGILQIRTHDQLLSSTKYRIDAEVWSDAHLGLARYNLNSLAELERLRELIVSLRPPLFGTLNFRKVQTAITRASNLVLSGTQEREGGDSSKTLSSSIDDQKHANLNEDQSSALNMVINAKDYTLILGMPGTGKTTTIAAIVSSLIERGKTVLLSAYTNSAVDTIVLKLLASNIKCFRLATSKLENIHPDVLPVTVSANGVQAGVAALSDFLECPVVACTSHSASNKLFSLRKFDVCILDEASQITLPFCIGPLRLASSFVLVGDHYQLPPLVRNKKARELGLTESLFKILCEAHPEAVVELTKQYRMCADIMSLSSELVYGGRLVCGTESVANQKLDINLASTDPKFGNLEAIDPTNRVVFLNTDTLGSLAFEQVHPDGSSNETEAKIIEGVVNQLSQCELDMKNLAVISVYRQQLSRLTLVLDRFVKRGLEVLTADQAQGRDKRSIIVSLVRSNESAHSGELLKDWRRLNVAFTRAKQKLVIVGSKRTMQKATGVSAFFDYIERRKWVYDARL